LYVYRCNRHEWYCDERTLLIAERWKKTEFGWEYAPVPMITEIEAQQLDCSFEYIQVNTECEKNKR